MKKVTLIAVVLLAAFCSKGFAQKSELRIAIADVEKIAKELPEAIDADKKLTEMRNKALDTMKLLETRFKDKFESYNKGKAMMTADAQKKEEDELRGLQMQYQQYQEENFGAQGVVAKKRDELLRPILQRIQEAVQTVAKEEKYNFVFDKAATSVMIYADDKTDITFKVIDKLKRGSK